jgi:hypothetical protein
MSDSIYFQPFILHQIQFRAERFPNALPNAKLWLIANMVLNWYCRTYDSAVLSTREWKMWIALIISGNRISHAYRAEKVIPESCHRHLQVIFQVCVFLSAMGENLSGP